MASEHQQFARPVEGVGRRKEMGEKERTVCNSLQGEGVSLVSCWLARLCQWLSRGPNGLAACIPVEGTGLGHREMAVRKKPQRKFMYQSRGWGGWRGKGKVHSFHSQPPTSLLFALLLQTDHYLHPLQNGISSHLSEFHGFLSTILSIFLFFKLKKKLFSVLNICPFSLKSLIKFYQTGLSWY